MDAVTVGITQASTDCPLPADSAATPWQWVEVMGGTAGVHYWINPTGGAVARRAPGSVLVLGQQTFGFAYPRAGLVKAMSAVDGETTDLNFVVFTTGDVPGGFEAE